MAVAPGGALDSLRRRAERRPRRARGTVIGASLFGRKRKQEEAVAEATREAERHALFARLATRPEDVCPFLGLADDRVGFKEGVSPEHRCYAFGDPAPLSDEQQSRVCLDRGYGNCPRYLRGVLVIPTEELEALRRPAPAATPQPATPPPPPPPPRRRRPVAGWLIALLLVVLVGGAAGAVLLAGGLGPVAVGSPTPTPSAASVLPSESPTPGQPTASPTPELTPAPSDLFIGYEVEVAPGDYPLFRVNDQGDVTDSTNGDFDRGSRAPVDRVEAQNGLLHWRTVGGGYDGFSYIKGQSGEFLIREVYRGPDGSLRYVHLTPEDT